MEQEVEDVFAMDLQYLSSLIVKNELPPKKEKRMICRFCMKDAELLDETSAIARTWNALIVRGLILNATELQLEEVDGDVFIRYVVEGVVVTDGKI